MSHVKRALRKYLAAEPKRLLWFLQKMPASYWQKEREAGILEIFHKTRLHVPAYRDYLTQFGVSHPAQIKTLADLESKVPIMDKQSYMLQYPLPERAISGSLDDLYAVSTSSGSMGKPYFAAHSEHGYKAIAASMSALFDYNWEIFEKKKRVLFINGVALGIWMGGVVADNALRIIRSKRKHFTYVAPGADPERIIDVIEQIGDQFDVVYLVSYPSMLKLAFEHADVRGVKLLDRNVVLTSFGELLDNSLRRYLLEKISPNPDSDITRIIDLYGGTEVGNPGIGTPLTVLIKNLTLNDPDLSEDIFGNRDSQGALFQANPSNAFVEEVGGELVVTQNDLIPVVRYNIHDCGHRISWGAMQTILHKRGYDMQKELAKVGWHKAVFKWEFIAFINRKDWAVSFYGAKVAPQSIQHLFAMDKRIYSFRLRTENEKGDFCFALWIELNPGLKLEKQEQAEMEKNYSKAVVEHLVSTNFDFKDAYSINKKALTPELIFCEFGKDIFTRARVGKSKLM